MDVLDKMIDTLTKENIIEIMTSFGVEYEYTHNGDLIFQARCHADDAKKLYYYESDSEGEESKHFLCYSRCGGMSIATTLMQVNNWEFSECLSFLSNYTGISITQKRERKFGKLKQVIQDWDFIDKYKRLERKKDDKLKRLPDFDDSVLRNFDNLYPSTWEDEGITPEAMKKFGICFYTIGWQAIVPHYDIWGSLIGIRARNFLYHRVEDGKKYMPLYFNETSYRHPIQYNLYGIHENLDTIKKLKKIILFEGEKSVLLCESFYPKENFSVALCGMNLTNYQRDLIVFELGVNEVIIALDKQYVSKLETEKQQKEYETYIKKVTNIADKLVNYVNVSIVYCDDDRLDYKDAPCDSGKVILEELMHEKERYYAEKD